MQNIVERLQSEESALPHKQRRLAQYMLRNSGDMCYLTLRQLAERAGVSEVTVLRLCRALGLDGFNAMKEGFRLYQQALRESYRELADSAARRPIDPGDKTAMLLHCFETEMHNVGKFSKLFSPEQYFPLARRIAQSRSVVVCGAEISHTLAQFLQQKLTFMGLSAFAPPIDRPAELQAILSRFGSEDTLIALSFPNYDQSLPNIIGFVRQRGAAVYGFTDHPDSPLSPLCDRCLYCQTGSVMAVNSMTVPFMAACLLVSAVALELPAGQRQAALRESMRFCDIRERLT